MIDKTEVDPRSEEYRTHACTCRMRAASCDGRHLQRGEDEDEGAGYGQQGQNFAIIFDHLVHFIGSISHHWQRESKPDLPPGMRKKSLHYMHYITINVKDILPYKVFLIKDQISLINEFPWQSTTQNEEIFSDRFTESKNHHILSCITDMFQIWHGFASDDSSIIILVSTAPGVLKYSVIQKLSILTRIFTVTDLNERIKDRLENDPRLHDLWAQGEVSNFVYHRSGHRYFTLKDRDSQISCVLFKNQAYRLGFDLKDGLNILVYGDIAVYRPQGRVQLVAKGIKQDAGLGFRHLQFEALKKKLASEGLFAIERKRRLPRYPERIGIVTSPQGAALRDVLRIIGPYPARIILSPAQVQGDGAEESIVSALRRCRAGMSS